MSPSPATGPSRPSKTTHRILAGDARRLEGVESESCHLVVTSPPYPMVEMWDATFRALRPEIGEALERGDGAAAFALMHEELDEAWRACHRALKPGGIACVNVGDAVRTVGGEFRLYSNHARILSAAAEIGFTPLPDILWRKPTNAPNKFLGSGMLPPGAYVTYEHEYVLVFRKGPPRAFAAEEAKLRRRSAFFWEERNVWFSDVWLGLAGAAQDLPGSAARERSGAFPFELAYRLVQMFSVEGDAVLDPFAGTGTTLVAAAASGRSSIGVEIDGTLRDVAARALERAPRLGARRAEERLRAHRAFVEERTRAGKPPKHTNRRYGFPVVTSQETDLVLACARSIREVAPGTFEAETADVEGAARDIEELPPAEPRRYDRDVGDEIPEGRLP